MRLVALNDDEWRTRDTVHFYATCLKLLNENAHSREAAELQLAHKFGSDVEHTYHRTRLLIQRAELLGLWYRFLVGYDTIYV